MRVRECACARVRARQLHGSYFTAPLRQHETTRRRKTGDGPTGANERTYLHDIFPFCPLRRRERRLERRNKLRVVLLARGGVRLTRAARSARERRRVVGVDEVAPLLAIAHARRRLHRRTRRRRAARRRAAGRRLQRRRTPLRRGLRACRRGRARGSARQRHRQRLGSLRRVRFCSRDPRHVLIGDRAPHLVATKRRSKQKNR